MRVNSFKICSGAVKVDCVCSKCGKPLDSSFVHCPMCGRKLEKVIQTLSCDKVCSLINNYLHSSNNKSEHKETSTVTGVVACPRGMTHADGCEFLEKDGTCSGIVYPTYPPQLDKCTLLTPTKLDIDKQGYTGDTIIPNFR